MKQTEDEDFWTDITTLREPAWREPTDDDLIDLDDQVREVVSQLAGRLSLREQEYRGAGQPVPVAVVTSPDWQLALLRAAHAAHASVDRLAAQAAKCAGGLGVSYPKLGAAWGISKQGARKKWPGVVDARGGQAERTELALYGGDAQVSYLADQSAWSWLGTAADDTYEEAEVTYETQAEAIAAAGVFLHAHAQVTA